MSLRTSSIQIKKQKCEYVIFVCLHFSTYFVHVLSGWTRVLPLGEADHMCIKAKRPSLLRLF